MSAEKLLSKEYSTQNKTFDVFMELACSPEDFIRKAISENYYTPTEVLQILVNDKSAAVRENVAVHPNTTSNMLRILLKDENRDVRMACLANYDITLPMIVKLLTVETDAGVREEASERIRDFSKESLRSALIDTGLHHMIDLPYEWVMKVLKKC